MSKLVVQDKLQTQASISSLELFHYEEEKYMK